MDFVPKTKQFDHQHAFLEEHYDAEAFAMWWEQGTGKSKGLIDNSAMLYCDGAIGGQFVLAPNGLHRNFVTKELPKHLPDAIAEKAKALFWRTDKSGTKWHQNEARELLAHKGFTTLAMSYDGIMTEDGRKLAKEYLQGRRCMYGMDESGRIANPEADRTIRVLGSAPFAPFRRGMTGTPIAGRPWDVYTQIKFLDANFWKPYGLDSPEAMKTAFGVWDRVGKRVTAQQAKRGKGLEKHYDRVGMPEELRTKYREDGDGTAFMLLPVIKKNDYGRPQYKNLERLREIVSKIRSRVLKKDVFDLPPKMYTPVEYEMAPAQRRAYDSLKKLGYAIHEESGGLMTSPMAMTTILRLQQIACGYLVQDLDPNDTSEEPKVHAFEPNPRIDIMLEITEGLDHPALIWARFRADIDQIMKGLAKQGKRAARYDGTISDDECAENEDRFHRGEVQFLVLNPAKGSEGLTLNEAKTVIYYSNSFKLIDRLQSEDRNHRYGQYNAVNYIDLIARGTVDEQIVESLQAKYDVASVVTGDGLRSWLAPSDGFL